MKIIECVPNFSEGRDIDKIERIMAVVKSSKTVKLINYESDADYNRTVVTLIGEPEPMIDLMMALTKVCLKEIDLNHHTGEHARMGAIDVIPFIPISDVTMKECVSYAERLAEQMGQTYEIPCFLYAQAARQDARVSLPNIRKGEFEGMSEKITQAEWRPDYGPARNHETFGAVAIGARDFLIAYNIDLDTKDETPAKKMAQAIRQSSGGFQYIQAGPVYLENRGHTQVTMNILNYKKNPIYRIFETVVMEAKRYHIQVPSAEIVGLIPKDALIRSIRYYYDCLGQSWPEDATLEAVADAARTHLKLRDFNEEKIIEYFL